MNSSELRVAVIRSCKGESRIYDHVTDVVIKDGFVTIGYRIGENGRANSCFPLSSMISISGAHETPEEKLKRSSNE